MVEQGGAGEHAGALRNRIQGVGGRGTHWRSRAAVRYTAAGVQLMAAWTSGCHRRRLGRRAMVEDNEVHGLDGVVGGGRTVAVNDECSRKKMASSEGLAPTAMAVGSG
jgi:hypothetical protein